MHESTFSPWRRGNLCYYGYQARDGSLAVACLSDRLRKRVADILGIDGIDDPRFEPGHDALSEEAAASSERLVKAAEELFHERTVEEWLDGFDRAGVPAGPVKYVQELLDDEQVAANDLVVELDHALAGKVRMVGPIIDMSDTPPVGPAPIASPRGAYGRNPQIHWPRRGGSPATEGRGSDPLRPNGLEMLELRQTSAI